MNETQNSKTGSTGRLDGRLLEYGVRIIAASQSLPRTDVGRHVSLQMLRSGTSAGANCQEARGAESRSDFIHKMQIVLKELRETCYWLCIAEKAHLTPARCLKEIVQESDELIAMTVKSIVTARSRQ